MLLFCKGVRFFFFTLYNLGRILLFLSIKKNSEPFMLAWKAVSGRLLMINFLVVNRCTTSITSEESANHILLFSAC